MTRKFVSAKEFGAIHGVGPRQVTVWCNRGLVSGAQKMPGRTGLWIMPKNATVLRPTKNINKPKSVKKTQEATKKKSVQSKKPEKTEQLKLEL